MTRLRARRRTALTETAETIARLEQECTHLRWERDKLAAQSTDVTGLWLQLTETAAECDTLRAELTRLQAERQGPAPRTATPGTDRLAWVTMAVGGQVPDSRASVTGH